MPIYYEEGLGCHRLATSIPMSPVGKPEMPLGWKRVVVYVCEQIIEVVVVDV